MALLNGSHSLLAYAGTIVGHETVADAIGDERCRSWVEAWWDEACRQLPLPGDELDAYRAALLDRFANPNIRHALAQIAGDGSLKLPVRIVPTLRAEVAAGRTPTGAARVIAAWVLHLRGLGAPVKDVNAERLTPLAEGTLDESVGKVLTFLDADLPGVREAVLAAAQELAASAS
ncbi:hypothetical protein ET996_00045 [Propioniciclava tarda]|uniref:Mannitol dehydrogenase C-terminal domain-containing protein n=1 Tax=Propioniciclava tarda TaxID=433330 RepID=A0A4Q9KNH1_PROTD|nr:hypothetical protein ET996_00045 [Propioniciclava tarda]